jgi:glycosyltransferase involved in cell wall biosynthesis
MIVAHVGPPPGRIGGPAGYLHQLQSGASTDPQARHVVRFPPASTTAPKRPPPPPLSLLTRLRRKVIGPKFYRPSVKELAASRGLVDRMLRDIAMDTCAESEASLASTSGVGVIFTHDPFSAEAALRQRAASQQVWMMCHGVTPIVLYAVWSWGIPEADWRSFLDYPDVRTWIEWELDVWSRVDCLVFPCPEATDSFRIIDSRFDALADRAQFVLSGAAAPMSTASSGADPISIGADLTSSGVDLPGPRSKKKRVGLYLGSAEPYRGFDALLAAADLLSPSANLAIAVAGPPRSKVPEHSLLRALGRVDDVAALFASVDFLINVNRFSLFDLSTIEAAEAGKPLLLHAVGGNRAFQRLGAGCVMLRDLDPATIAAGLAHVASLEESMLFALGRQSRECWECQLTPRHMWARHLALYDAAAERA